MKKSWFLAFFLICVVGFSFSQTIPPAPIDKAVVYFVRPSSMGALINFTYLDSNKVIGKFNGPKYIRLECSPGKHLFWARSENRDFVEADVEAGKIYFIEALVKMGAFKAAVELKPMDAKDTKLVLKIMKLLAKRTSESFTQQELDNETNLMQEPILRGLAKYHEEKLQGIKHPIMTKNMNYDTSTAPSQP